MHLCMIIHFSRVTNMASTVFIKQWISALVLLFIVLFCFRLGEAATGIAGTGIGYIPEPGSGSGNHGGGGVVTNGTSGGGINGTRGGDESEEIIMKALQCFSDKYVYSSCEESYRLTASGELHVPPECTDEYCSGPCLKEAHLVLNCIDGILSHFVFDNHATISDVNETIKTGCSYGPNRGHFNVTQNIQGDKSNSYKLSYPILLGLAPLILVFNLLF